jgi:hypothetical protein
MSKLGKREGPDPVEPVVIGGVRYEAVHWGSEIGADQNGGYIAAVDPVTGNRLWTLKVYDIDYDPARERDVQDVFITKLSAAESAGKLRVTDEDGRNFIVDPQSRTASQL